MAITMLKGHRTSMGARLCGTYGGFLAL